MSIYGSTVVFSDDDHEDRCATYTEVEPGILDFSGEPCSCGTPWAPIVYEGSHILPSDDDRRGGSIDVATIPGFIQREGREAIPDDSYHPWLRLSVQNVASTTQYEGKPYVRAGDAAVILDARQVQLLMEFFDEWLGVVSRHETIR